MGGGGRVACEQTLGERVGAGRGEGARELACGLGEGRGEGRYKKVWRYGDTVLCSTGVPRMFEVPQRNLQNWNPILSFMTALAFLVTPV